MQKPYRLSTLAFLAVATLNVGFVAWSANNYQNGKRTSAPTTTSNAESQFLADNSAAMNKMMAAMSVPPTGYVDADFVAVMIPHHQGAIDMAQAVLRYGKNEQIRRLAQEIIITQQEEIAAMRLAIGQAASAPGAHTS